MPILRSGDVIKLAPDRNNRSGYKSLHLIHPDLFMYRHFGAADMSYVAQESAEMGGDRRLYAVSLGKGSLTLPKCSQAALDAILEHIDFNGLDAEATIHFWNKREFKDFSVTIQYLPSEDQESDPCDVFVVKFELINMSEIG